MTYCHKCGKEVAADAAYCIYCGARVGEPFPWGRWRERDWERHWRREKERDGWWGAVNAFGFLIIIALTISRYPDVFTLIARYLGSWGTHGYPILPGYDLGQVMIYLFTASGIWGVLSSCLRFAFTTSFARPMRGIVGAMFALYIASSLSQYYSGAIKGSGLVLDFFVGLAIVIVANAMIAYFVPHRINRTKTD